MTGSKANRVRADADARMARLFRRADRATRRAESLLRFARDADDRRDPVARLQVRRQTIAQLGDLQRVCSVLEMERRELADALLLTSQLSAASNAYRRHHGKGDLR